MQHFAHDDEHVNDSVHQIETDADTIHQLLDVYDNLLLDKLQ